jgi:hypothetical protein
MQCAFAVASLKWRNRRICRLNSARSRYCSRERSWPALMDCQILVSPETQPLAGVPRGSRSLPADLES